MLKLNCRSKLTIKRIEKHKQLKNSRYLVELNYQMPDISCVIPIKKTEYDASV